VAADTALSTAQTLESFHDKNKAPEGDLRLMKADLDLFRLIKASPAEVMQVDEGTHSH